MMGLFGKKDKSEPDFYKSKKLHKYIYPTLEKGVKSDILQKEGSNNYIDIEIVHKDDLDPYFLFNEDMPSITVPSVLEITLAEKWNENNKYKIELTGWGKFATNIDVDDDERRSITYKRNSVPYSAKSDVLDASKEYCVYEFIGKPGIPSTLGIVVWSRLVDEPRKRVPSVTLEDIVMLSKTEKELKKVWPEDSVRNVKKD